MKKIKGRKSFKCRITSVLICAVMLLSMLLPSITISAEDVGNTTEEIVEPVAEEQGISRTADASTINDWKKFFGDEMGTTNVGKIWMDKTVSDGGIVLESADSTDPIATIEKQDEDNFLIGLSALSSNQSIGGESSLPMDVVLLIDISLSMWTWQGSDNRNGVQMLVEAVNFTITEIQNANKQNRVGVVLFSGSPNFESSKVDTAISVMPLSRYTANNNEYFQSDEYGAIVKLSDSLESLEGFPLDKKSYIVQGLTYIQNGLLETLEMFQSRTQDGVSRIPILTFFSDGAPTAATEKYTERGDATIEWNEKGSSPSNLCKVLLTQLTAAWVKAKIQEEYSEQHPLFYSIGLLDKEAEDYNCSKMVLTPDKATTDALDAYWENFFSLNQGESLKYIAQSPSEESVDIIKADTEIANRYYMNKFIEINNPDDLTGAFSEIVKEIELQSFIYPTYIDKSNPNHSGYLTFEDEIGEYMQVKHIRGIMYGDVLHTGCVFASKMIGNKDQNFIDSISQRLNISIDEATLLFNNACSEKQISYTSDSEFSNYVGWYADLNGNYLGPYTEGGILPANAKQINRSYFYSGKASGTISETDMIYLEVRVSEELESKKQNVQFIIPGSLIPVIQYQITKQFVEEGQENVEVQKTESSPVHLFYEVGVRAEIGEYDWSAVRTDYPFQNQTESIRECLFYTNAWDKDQGIGNTLISFKPSSQNENYYYTKNSKIYIKDAANYIPYTGGEKPVSDTYYYQKISYLPDNMNREQYLEKLDYCEISPRELENVFFEEDGWYVPKGTVKANAANEKQYKETLEPDSYIGVDYIIQTVDVLDGSNEIYINGTLGNNGCLNLRQGKIEIKKEVTDNNYAEGDNDDTDFNFCITTESTKTGVSSVKISEEVNGEFITQQTESGILNFTLKNHQSKAYWFPLGEQVSVEEVIKNGEKKYLTTVNVIRGGEEILKGNEKVDIIVSEEKANVCFFNNYNDMKIQFSIQKTNEKGSGLQGGVFTLYKCKEPEPLPPSKPYPPDDPKDPNYSQDMLEYNTALKEYQIKLNQYKIDYQNYEKHIKEKHDKLIVEDESEETCWIRIAERISGDNGGIRFGYMKRGNYRLVETHAPEGYMQPQGQWNVRIVPNGDVSCTFTYVLGPNGEKPPTVEESESTYLIHNYKPIDPPITGGRGIWQYFLFGAVITFGGVGLIIYQIRRKKHGNS